MAYSLRCGCVIYKDIVTPCKQHKVIFDEYKEQNRLLREALGFLFEYLETEFPDELKNDLKIIPELRQAKALAATESKG